MLKVCSFLSVIWCCYVLVILVDHEMIHYSLWGYMEKEFLASFVCFNSLVYELIVYSIYVVCLFLNACAHIYIWFRSACINDMLQVELKPSAFWLQKGFLVTGSYCDIKVQNHTSNACIYFCKCSFVLNSLGETCWVMYLKK